MSSLIVNELQLGFYPFISGFIGLAAALAFTFKVMNTPTGNETMVEIADAIEEGAYYFIKTEYKYLLIFVMAINILIMAAVDWRTGICYLVGAGGSALCGFIGLAISVKANVRTAQAASLPDGLNEALRVAFSSGAVMGLCVVSIALIGLSSLYMIFGTTGSFSSSGYLPGFGLGASSVSLFTRIGGGIYTKAPDVGADLVGKVEAGIPEDDARNPATIADNVGDNVGDVAGMGADIFGSFAGSIIATCLLGYSQKFNVSGAPSCMDTTGALINMYECGLLNYLALPFWISSSGVVASLIGLMCVRTKEGATQNDVLGSVSIGLYISMFFQFGFMAIVIYVLNLSWKLFGCIVIGLVCGRAIGSNTEYFTSFSYSPTISIAQAGLTGPASVVIRGLSVGMLSTILPGLVIAGTVLASINLAGFYGLALASTGLLSNLAITLATDAFGPVADNAGGIAEMSMMPAEVREKTDVLDALGNTTAAVGKGFAMASAVLTGLGYLSSYVTRVDLNAIAIVVNSKVTAVLAQVQDGSQGYTMAGLLVGAMIPFAFGAVTMGAVAEAAMGVVYEVRRQFRTYPGIMDRTQKPDYAECVKIVTEFSIMSLMLPAIVVVAPPLVIGVGLGPHALGGMLSSSIVCSFVLGLTMSAAGGAWDNAKKYVEGGHMVVGGVVMKKGTDLHKAVVVGDTIGDPFKDTSGPSLNILVKVSTSMGVVLAPIFKNQQDYWWASLILIGILCIFTPLWVRHLDKVLATGMEGNTSAASFVGEEEKKKKEAAAPAPVADAGGVAVSIESGPQNKDL
jgi:K(+)-stimulated pyrophosphate-energized sodium pump